MTSADANDKNILHKLLKEAIEMGVDGLEVERDDGEEIVYARKGNTGISIAAFDSDSPEAEQLRKELYKTKRKNIKLTISGITYLVKVKTFDSFGDDVFNLSIQKAK